MRLKLLHHSVSSLQIDNLKLKSKISRKKFWHIKFCFTVKIYFTYLMFSSFNSVTSSRRRVAFSSTATQPPSFSFQQNIYYRRLKICLAQNYDVNFNTLEVDTHLIFIKVFCHFTTQLHSHFNGPHRNGLLYDGFTKTCL